MLEEYEEPTILPESEDPFYSESNIRYLEKILEDIGTGRAKLVEHDLIDD